MIEGTRLLAGEATLSGEATTDRAENERSRAQSEHDVLERLLETMVRQHSRLVYRIAFALLRRHHDAEDATQETFMRVLRYRSKLAAVEDPKTGRARIAWRVAVDRSRARPHVRDRSAKTPMSRSRNRLQPTLRRATRPCRGPR